MTEVGLVTLHGRNVSDESRRLPINHGMGKTQLRRIRYTNAMRSLGVPPSTSEAETVAILFVTCM